LALKKTLETKEKKPSKHTHTHTHRSKKAQTEPGTNTKTFLGETRPWLGETQLLEKKWTGNEPASETDGLMNRC